MGSLRPATARHDPARAQALDPRSRLSHLPRRPVVRRHDGPRPPAGDVVRRARAAGHGRRRRRRALGRARPRPHRRLVRRRRRQRIRPHASASTTAPRAPTTPGAPPPGTCGQHLRQLYVPRGAPRHQPRRPAHRRMRVPRALPMPRKLSGKAYARSGRQRRIAGCGDGGAGARGRARAIHGAPSSPLGRVRARRASGRRSPQRAGAHPDAPAGGWGAQPGPGRANGDDGAPCGRARRGPRAPAAPSPESQRALAVDLVLF